MPDCLVACSFESLAPSQMAISSLVSFTNKISRCFGLIAFGKSNTIDSSWSTPET
jgi:hypothetical protein